MNTRPRIIEREHPPAPALPSALHPVTRRVLAARGVLEPAALDTSLAGLAKPTGLDGLTCAAARIAAALTGGERMLVIGDFDADGATSTALALRAMRAMGAAAADFLVPNRFEYGYGLTPEIVDLAAASAPALIITVDNGIASVEGVARAAAHGIDVVITDHHLPGARLPAAAAIVNPNLPGDAFPSKHLAGVGVIFYVMSALRARLRELGWFDEQRIEPPNLARLLDLVALGTVADVVRLDQNNRRLVAQGIERIRAGQCQPGVAALADAAGRDRTRLSAGDLAFALGPRLNAAGRLADMSVGIECLLSDDPARCAAIAGELDRLNRERREIEGEMRDQAFAAIESELRRWSEDALPSAFCVFDESWHPGVVGIVAARIKERFHRPAIAFAPGDGGMLKGSARSIPGLHVRDALDAVASANPGLLDRFGGHAMAAGLSIERERFSEFARAFQAAVEARVEREALEQVIATDGALAEDEFDLGLARELAAVAPWGQGFPEPRFAGLFRIADRRVVGGDHARLVLETDGGTVVHAIAFGAARQPWFIDAERVLAVYKLDVNAWRGAETLQLVVDYAEACR